MAQLILRRYVDLEPPVSYRLLPRLNKTRPIPDPIKGSRNGQQFSDL
jgi:hypothetical protein